MIDYEPVSNSDKEPLWGSVLWWLGVSAVGAFYLLIATAMVLFVLFFEAD